MKIAVVANTYTDAKAFVEYKFKKKILQVNSTHGTYHLDDGTVIYLCYDERSREKYLSMEYDALVVAPGYQSLLDVIRNRCSRAMFERE